MQRIDISLKELQFWASRAGPWQFVTTMLSPDTTIQCSNTEMDIFTPNAFDCSTILLQSYVANIPIKCTAMKTKKPN